MKPTICLQKKLGNENIQLESNDKGWAVRIGSKVRMWFTDYSRAEQFFWNLG